ncbi:DNA polymerase III subunit gamma/tau [Candidatus Omnitrophota bacterium]
MSYLAFARKYRPQDLSQVIGQESIVKRLSEAILSERIHHAFLFSGPRGVGKTSLARILAKTLNCLKSDKPTTKPCLVCTSCKEIQQGNSLDVIEIDGASNRGIEEIRQLRENIKFAPAYGRFKIYIIDEVHQITPDAFNALLKTLEEPPAHVKFIFATTNPNKVPVTILSRCQRFNFSLIAEDKIIEKLKYISQKEKIPVDDQILKYLARASGGSIRDAESVFDQVAPLLLEGTTLEQTLDILGQVPEHEVMTFIGSLLAMQPAKSLESIHVIIEQGHSLDNFLTAAIECVRNTMFAKLGENFFVKTVDLPEDSRKAVLTLASGADIARLVRIVDAFIEVKRTARFLSSLRIPLEVAVVKLTHTTKSPQDLPVKQPAVPSQPKPAEKKDFGFQHKTASLNLENVTRFVDGLKSGFRHHKPKDQEETPEEHPQAEFTIEDVRAIWAVTLEDIAEKKMAVATYLKEVQLLKVEGRIIYLGLPKNLTFHKESLEDKEYKQFVEAILMQKLDRKLGIYYTLTDEIKELKYNDSSKEAINKIVDAFGGEVVT